jgi:hypothetical protein
MIQLLVLIVSFSLSTPAFADYDKNIFADNISKIIAKECLNNPTENCARGSSAAQLIKSTCGLLKVDWEKEECLDLANIGARKGLEIIEEDRYSREREEKIKAEEKENEELRIKQAQENMERQIIEEQKRLQEQKILADQYKFIEHKRMADLAFRNREGFQGIIIDLWVVMSLILSLAIIKFDGIRKKIKAE